MMPDQLWSLTLPEFNAKLEGWKMLHPSAKDAVTPMTRSEMEDMIEEFPDGPTPLEVRRRRKRERNHLKVIHGGRDS